MREFREAPKSSEQESEAERLRRFERNLRRREAGLPIEVPPHSEKPKDLDRIVYDRIREQQRREGIDEGDARVEHRGFLRSDFMRTIDALLSDMSPGHQNWNAVEKKLLERSVYNAFVSDTKGSHPSFTDWPKTAYAISLKLQEIVRQEGLDKARQTIAQLKSTDALLRK